MSSLGKNQFFVLHSLRRPLVKAGGSAAHISCFCISVLVNSCRLAVGYRILGLGNGPVEAVPRARLFLASLVEAVGDCSAEPLDSHICEVFLRTWDIKF